MDTLKIEKTNDTPQVVLDAENNEFEFSYRSLPENAIDFYNPILDWLNEFAKNPNPEIEVNFKLEYFNTASAKQIAKILLIFQEISKKAKVKIKWFYDKEDIDMLSSGERYSKLIKLDFEFIEL